MKIEHLLYELQHRIGIIPKWEKKLIEKDSHLKMFLKWKKSKLCSSQQCEELYHNRLNYLKGWLGYDK
jgi:hypothetical protein